MRNHKFLCKTCRCTIRGEIKSGATRAVAPGLAHLVVIANSKLFNFLAHQRVAPGPGRVQPIFPARTRYSPERREGKKLSSFLFSKKKSCHHSQKKEKKSYRQSNRRVSAVPSARQDSRLPCSSPFLIARYGDRGKAKTLAAASLAPPFAPKHDTTQHTAFMARRCDAAEAEQAGKGTPPHGGTDGRRAHCRGRRLRPYQQGPQIRY